MNAKYEVLAWNCGCWCRNKDWWALYIFSKSIFLHCKKSEIECLPEYSKYMVLGAYKNMIKYGQTIGNFTIKIIKENSNTVPIMILFIC